SRVRLKETAVDQMWQVGDVGAVPDGSGWYAKRCGELEDLLDRVLHEPWVHFRADVCSLMLPGPLIVPLHAADEIGSTHHGQNVVPLLHGDGGQADVAVLAPLDARHHGHRQLT